MQEIAHQHLFNQFWVTLFFVIPMVLVARAVVAGTRYSAILIIVIFGLLMGYLLVATGVSQPGLADFPMLGMMAQSTIIALAASFFVGGQELRRIFGEGKVTADESVVYATEQIFFGTGRTHVIFIARAFFMLLGIEALTKTLLGNVPGTRAHVNEFLAVALWFVCGDPRGYGRRGGSRIDCFRIRNALPRAPAGVFHVWSRHGKQWGDAQAPSPHFSNCRYSWSGGSTSVIAISMILDRLLL